MELSIPQMISEAWNWQRNTDALSQEPIAVSLFTTNDVDSPGIEPGRLWLEAAADWPYEVR